MNDHSELADKIEQLRLARNTDNVPEMRKAERRLEAALVIDSETIRYGGAD